MLGRGDSTLSNPTRKRLGLFTLHGLDKAAVLAVAVGADPVGGVAEPLSDAS